MLEVLGLRGDNLEEFEAAMGFVLLAEALPLVDELEAEDEDIDDADHGDTVGVALEDE